MNMDETIGRINELAHKQKGEGLNEEEKEEQRLLRQKYIAAIKGNLKAQLDNIRIVDENGNVTKLKKK
ncbi:MAG: DUF896 domain-containing protein [Lachnospiraceae bacterium]|nr:DUF896 domain-containing protein [Lachnospiraceae bacterium]